MLFTTPAQAFNEARKIVDNKVEGCRLSEASSEEVEEAELPIVIALPTVEWYAVVFATPKYMRHERGGHLLGT